VFAFGIALVASYEGFQVERKRRQRRPATNPFGVEAFF